MSAYFVTSRQGATPVRITDEHEPTVHYSYKVWQARWCLKTQKTFGIFVKLNIYSLLALVLTEDKGKLFIGSNITSEVLQPRLLV
jgi:hypothetical protein